MSAITVERSQREQGGKVWWWLNGETYPHRDLLKGLGARWSKKRQAWYWVGAELPAAIRALVMSETQPETPSPLLAIFGGRIVGSEQSSDGETILKGENGVFATRTTWIDRNDRPETVWVFDLPPHDRIGISLPAIHDALKRARATFSIYSRRWHFEGADKVAAMDALAGTLPAAMSPELAAMIEQALADDDAAHALPPAPDDPPPAIRIIKPVPMPSDGAPLDAVQTAIRDTTPQGWVAPAASLANGRITRIDQTFVGELTGSITGQVFCYGYAVHEGVCVFVNMAGPRVAVEAIRAKLGKSEIVTVVPPDAPSVELTAGEGNTGMYHPYLHYLPEARFASLILVHDWAVTPNYGGKATTFIFRASDAQATARLKHHVTQLVNVPVFDAWSAYLYEAGQRAMLVRRTRSAGGIDLLSVDLDADAWTRLITGGLGQGVISLPA